MRLLRRFASRNDKIVYRITYNVYRLNTVASRKLLPGFVRGIPRPFGTPLSRGESFPLNILQYRNFNDPITQDKELICYKKFSKTRYAFLGTIFFFIF